LHRRCGTVLAIIVIGVGVDAMSLELVSSLFVVGTRSIDPKPCATTAECPDSESNIMEMALDSTK
jgi:hypothetical protein